MVAIFCGKKKPEPIEEFIQEYEHRNSNSITINSVNYTIHANAFIADVPARFKMHEGS